VEDEIVIQKELAEILGFYCNNLYLASNGQEGIEKYKEYNPDLIITDINMPIMDGIDMIKNIKEISEDVHVIFITAFSDSDYLLESIELQADGYIIKPVKLKLLQKKINKIADKLQLEARLYEKNRFAKDVLDASDTFIVVTDGVKMKMANQSLLSFIGFDTLEEFSSKYNCVCDFFIQEDGYFSNGEQNWVKQVLQNQDKVHKVKMLGRDDQEHIFLLDIKETVLHNETNYIIILTDVTNLEKMNKDRLRQEKLLSEQQKMASMGHMVGNIAHQWRQPLNAIISTISAMQYQRQLGKLNDDIIDKDLQDIKDSSQYLSETINTFRNFLKEKKSFTKVILQERIDVALIIVTTVLKDSHIELRRDISDEPIEISLVLGELIEVIINIINNAKDALVENKTKNPWIELSLKKEDNKAIITIEDNAGGIPHDVLPKIFDRYFTTKPDDIGTGLGLDMSRQIIQDSLNGKLYVENSQNGAKFFIELPIS
jgi:signal transduction histidine kinase/CheY-like chemotaxis protein